MARLPVTADPLIAALQRRAIDVVGSVIPRGRPVALLDFPRHFNVGDSAIWLGEMRCLAAYGVRPRDIRYVCDLNTYDETALRRAIGDEGVILSHGGGNFGDLWESHQHFRESVVAAFPGNAIVILPQTVHFKDRAVLERTVRVFDTHENVTILVRDQPSLKIVQDNFRAAAHLCPDLAFWLGALPRPVPADRPVVYLARKDQESRLAHEDQGSVTAEPCDWPLLNADRQWRVGDSISRFEVDHPRLARGLPESLVTAARRYGYQEMGRERLRAGCELLAHGRVVITDRLHAHILSLLMGIPSVVLDNSYGKVRGFLEAWTLSSPLTHFAQTPEEAFATAAGLNA